MMKKLDIDIMQLAPILVFDADNGYSMETHVYWDETETHHHVMIHLDEQARYFVDGCRVSPEHPLCRWLGERRVLH